MAGEILDSAVLLCEVFGKAGLAFGAEREKGAKLQ